MTVHKSEETIQGRKLFKGGSYLRKYGVRKFPHFTLSSKGMVLAETIWGNTVTENLDNFGKMDGPLIIEIDRTNSTM